MESWLACFNLLNTRVWFEIVVIENSFYFDYFKLHKYLTTSCGPILFLHLAIIWFPSTLPSFQVGFQSERLRTCRKNMLLLKCFQTAQETWRQLVYRASCPQKTSRALNTTCSSTNSSVNDLSGTPFFFAQKTWLNLQFRERNLHLKDPTSNWLRAKIGFERSHFESWILDSNFLSFGAFKKIGIKSNEL